jgi:hypothetical protein
METEKKSLIWKGLAEFCRIFMRKVVKRGIIVRS